MKCQRPVRSRFPADSAVKIRVQNGVGQGHTRNLRPFRNHQPLSRVCLIFITNRRAHPHRNLLRLPSKPARDPEVIQGPSGLLLLRPNQPKAAGNLVVSHPIITANLRHHPMTRALLPGRIILRRSPNQSRSRKPSRLRHQAVSGKYRPVAVTNQVNHRLPAPNLPAPSKQALSVTALYPAPNQLINPARKGDHFSLPPHRGQRKDQHRPVVFSQRLPARPDGEPLRRSHLPRLLPGRKNEYGLGRIIAGPCGDIHVKSVPLVHVSSPPITACFSENCRRTGRSPPPGKGRVRHRNKPQRWRPPPPSPARGTKAHSAPDPRFGPARPGK